MAMEPTASADLSGMGLGSEVPLAAVGRSLRQLWESNEAVTRASAMNFAICSEDPDTAIQLLLLLSGELGSRLVRTSSQLAVLEHL